MDNNFSYRYKATNKENSRVHAPLHSLIHPLNSIHKAVKSTQASITQSSISDGFPPLRSRVRGLVHVSNI